jgi:broad specificity phosphatase PhoE
MDQAEQDQAALTALRDHRVAPFDLIILSLQRRSCQSAKALAQETGRTVRAVQLSRMRLRRAGLLPVPS